MVKRARRVGCGLVMALLCLSGVMPVHGVVPVMDGGHLDFTAYLGPNGAPVAKVTGIAATPDGALWVATWGEGVHRIDRTEWDTYTEVEGLPDDWVRSIWVSPTGDVWIGSGDGIGLIRGGVVHSILGAHLPEAVDPDIALVRVLSSGAIWAATWSGWVIRRPPLDPVSIDVATPWEVVATPAEARDSYLEQLIEAPDGVVFAAGHRGHLFVYRDGQWAETALPRPARHHVLFTTNDTGQEALWVKGHLPARLYRYVDGLWVEAGSVPDFRADAIVYDAQGSGFAATPWGLWADFGGGWASVAFPQALGTPQLEAVCVTADGALWLGGREGLIRGARRPWSPQPNGEGVMAFVPRADRSAPVLGLTPAGEVHFPGDGQWRYGYTIPTWPAAGAERVQSNWLGDGQVWRGRDERLHWLMLQGGQLHHIEETRHTRIDPDNGTVLAQVSLPPVPEYEGRFFLTTAGTLLAIAEYGVWAQQEAGWVPHPPSPGYEPTRAYVISETTPGTLWAGMRSGLERWDTQGVTRFGEAEGVQTQDSIHAIESDGTGIWMGTSGSGVYYYRDGTFRQFDKTSGLRSNQIRHIYVAHDGVVWLAYRGSGLSAYREGRWVHYGAVAGLPNEYIVALAEPTPGDLWATSSSGELFRYTPDRLPPETQIDVAAPEIGSHGVGVFSFSGWDAWRESKSLRYSWRTVRFDGDEADPGAWSPFTEERTVSPPPLEPGRYHFQVRSYDEHGNVDPTPAVIDFVVSPPFWRKPSFFLPVVLSLLTAVVMAAKRFQSHRALARSEQALRLEVKERERAEAMLQAHRADLERTVSARTQALHEAQEELIRKDRLATLGQLTATVSHELRNPLGTIQSSLYTIEKKVRDSGLNLDSALERTGRGIRRCNNIIEEMLDFTRSQAVSTAHVSLDEWLRDTLHELSVPGDVRVELDLTSRAVVALDEERMRRVLINLVDNSTQAMEGQTTEKLVRVSALRQDGVAQVTVEDSGPGISEDVLAHIFEPLFSTKNFGVGLGTNIAKNIVDRHQGTLHYSNRPAGGARVVLTLPCIDGGVPASDQA